MIYFDYASSTPCDKDVLERFNFVINNYIGNPNADNILGRKSKNFVDEETLLIANLLGVKPDEIIYTSGSTESNNLAIKGVCERYKNRGKHIIISPLEHNSITSPIASLSEKGYDVDIVSLDKNGRVDIKKLKDLIRKDTILVSITACDSELGILQPVEEIGKLLRDYNCIFHSDMTGVIGKVRVNLSDIDLITFSPHKFYGLSGIGALIKKEGIYLTPMIEGGRSTTIYRSGTPDVGLIASLAFALDKSLKEMDKNFSYVLDINRKLRSFLDNYKNVNINSPIDNLPYILNFSLRGINSNEFKDLLGKNGVIVSSKTSCCPINTPSKLVYAYTNDKSLASSSIRLSLSHLTNLDEIDKFKVIFDRCYKEKYGEI